MGTLRANTLKDHSNFFFHLGLAATVTTGVFMTLGSPIVLSGIAVGITAALQLGLVPLVKTAFQNAIDEEKEDGLKVKRGYDRYLNPKSTADFYYEKMRLGMVSGWADKFAKRFGIDTPSVLIMPPRDPWADILEKKDGSLRGFLRNTFNKHANAFAFDHEHGNVVLTNPIVNTLDVRELAGVVAHEVGHLAAGHTNKQMAIGTIMSPARIMAGLTKLITTFSSFKNFGLVWGASVITNAATDIIAGVKHLDKELPKDKAKLDFYKKYILSGVTAGLAVVFAAPDLLVAEGIRVATREAADFVSKRYSRRNEFQADRLAAELTRDPEGLSLGLEKIREHHLKAEPGFNHNAPRGQKKNALTSFFDQVKDIKATHPNVDRRVERLRSMDVPMAAWQPS